MVDDNKHLERDIKGIQEQIEKQHQNLEKQTLALSLLEQNIEGLYHDIFKKNSEIQAIENEEKDEFKDDDARLQFEEEIKQKQKEKLLNTKFQKTSEKSRMLVQEFYLNRYKTHNEKIMNQQIKLDVQSVKIMYLKVDPSEYLEKNGRNSTTVEFVVQTFSINKQTQIKDLFESAIEYFQVAGTKKDQHVLTDTNFNDLTLIYDYPVESYFSTLKESCLYAELYLKPKYTSQTVLLDKQQESISTYDASNTNQTSVDTEKKNLMTIFTNFEKVFSGIQLYSTQAKDDQNMMVQQKVKKRLQNILIPTFIIFIYLLSFLKQSWINLLHMILYIVVISSLINILANNNDSDVYNIKSNSQYFLQTFQGVENPIQDNYFFKKGLNGFSRMFKFSGSYSNDIPQASPFLMYSSYISLGTARIVIKRTSVTECDKIEEYDVPQDVFNALKCSKSILTLNTETKVPFNGVEWSSSSVTGFDHTIVGTLNSYEGSGYMFNYDPYISDVNVFNTATDDLDKQLDFQVKVIIVYGAFYDINKKTFLSVYYIVEISTSGIYIENQDVKYFKLHYPSEMTAADQSNYRTSIACIILIGLILLITISINIDKTYQIHKMNKEQKLNMRIRDIYFNLFSFQLIAEIMISIFIIIAHIFIYDLPDKSLSEVLKTQHPDSINIHRYGYQQEIGFNLLAFGLILLVIFLCINIPLNKETQSYQRMIQNSISPLIVVMVLIFTLICSIALVLQRVFGPFIMEFSTYEDAFYETIFVYFFGDYKIQQKMWDQNLILSLSIVGVVILTIFFGSVSLFNSVLFEKYRLVSTKLQFQQDQSTDVANQLNEKLKGLGSISCWKCFKKDNKPKTKKNESKSQKSKKPA